MALVVQPPEEPGLPVPPKPPATWRSSQTGSQLDRCVSGDTLVETQAGA